MGLEVLLGGRDELDGDKLVAAEMSTKNLTCDRMANAYPRCSKREIMGPTRPR